MKTTTDRYMTSALRACALALATLAAGCSGEDDWGGDAPMDEELGTREQLVKNGIFVGAKPGLLEISGTGTCTASLLNSHWLLTAAHCIDDGMTSRHGKVKLTVKHFTSTAPVQISGTMEEMDAFIIDTWDCFHQPDSCADYQDDLAIVKRKTPWIGTNDAHYFRINGGSVGGSIYDIGQIEFFGRGYFSDAGDGLGTLRKFAVTPNDASKHWFSDLEGTRGICRGDSGGPYIGKRVQHNGTQLINVVAGVAARVNMQSDDLCTYDGGTQWAARTNSRVDWIAEKMKQLNGGVDVCAKRPQYMTCF